MSYAVVTTEKWGSLSEGIAFEFTPDKLSSTVYLAVGQNRTTDCICPLIFIDNETCLNFTKCCIKDTLLFNFIEYCVDDNSNKIYKFRLKTLSLDIDNTRIHFHQSFNCNSRQCSPPLQYSYREYIYSYEILVGKF